MVDRLVELGIDILFVIGGDGSMRGASALVREIARARTARSRVIGVPKTIDNDIPFIGQSFGFVTAFSRAAKAISVGMVEARSAVGGVGLVKLMGRHSGFIACYAALANHDADFVLIPEVPFGLDGANGLLAYLHQRVKERGSAVVVVAEGAGQGLLEGNDATDESGNARFADIGVHLRDAITSHFAQMGSPLTLKYLEPATAIRSVRADPHDAVYCLRLAQAAVHAGMAGRTDMVVGRRHNRPIHVPISLVISERHQVAPGRRPVDERAGADRAAGRHALSTIPSGPRGSAPREPRAQSGAFKQRSTAAGASTHPAPLGAGGAGKFRTSRLDRPGSFADERGARARQQYPCHAERL